MACLVNALKLVINNCRSQSYDNASNMSSIYSGVQAHMRQINSLAVWVPCASHSLSLVGSSAAESCTNEVNCFSILQSLYSFFVALPQRWSKFISNMPNKAHVVKSLSETRWSALVDASKALATNYDSIRDSLKQLAASSRQPAMAVRDANLLVKKLNKMEILLLFVILNCE